MKRIIAFALALAVVFGMSFALYKPERIEATARETMDDEWVGYFFALEPFDGKVYATETGDDYDFGVPGVPVFVTITAFKPGEPDYEEGLGIQLFRRCGGVRRGRGQWNARQRRRQRQQLRDERRDMLCKRRMEAGQTVFRLPHK